MSVSEISWNNDEFVRLPKGQEWDNLNPIDFAYLSQIAKDLSEEKGS